MCKYSFNDKLCVIWARLTCDDSSLVFYVEDDCNIAVQAKVLVVVVLDLAGVDDCEAAARKQARQQHAHISTCDDYAIMHAHTNAHFASSYSVL